uniref:Uncharacterized protein n=1 Tax=Oryza glumipatula TaxID=40148 RepID=A0A0E0B5E4_9ORYZ
MARNRIGTHRRGRNRRWSSAAGVGEDDADLQDRCAIGWVLLPVPPPMAMAAAAAGVREAVIADQGEMGCFNINVRNARMTYILKRRE